MTGLPESAWSRAHPGISPRREPPASLRERIERASQKALGNYNLENRRLNQVMTPAKRKQLAEELRQTADALEKG